MSATSSATGSTASSVASTAPSPTVEASTITFRVRESTLVLSADGELTMEGESVATLHPDGTLEDKRGHTLGRLDASGHVEMELTLRIDIDADGVIRSSGDGRSRVMGYGSHTLTLDERGTLLQDDKAPEEGWLKSVHVDVPSAQEKQRAMFVLLMILSNGLAEKER